LVINDENSNNEKQQDLIIDSFIDDSLNNSPNQIIPILASQKTKLDRILDEWNQKYVRIVGSENAPIQAKAMKVLEFLLEAFENVYLYSRHLELICQLFEGLGLVSMTEHFGTYRVELVVTLFGCIVDLHNFEIVLRTLSSFETACVICRIGWLNIYNPMKPQGAYELDMSRREERIIVKSITTLSIAEPGDNLKELFFRWERGMDPMPGYVLTELWMTEDGLPKKGLWNVYYYSGKGHEKGFKASIKLRKALLQLVCTFI
jgi:hypothetical protein